MQSTKIIATITKDNIDYVLKLDAIGFISCFKGYDVHYFNKLEIGITDDSKIGMWYFMDDNFIMFDEVELNRKLTIKQQLINDIPVNNYFIK